MKTSQNITPIYAFWLINRSILNLEFKSQGTINLQRIKQCVLNLPSNDLVPTVNSMAIFTGTAYVPACKIKLGYRHDADKFETVGLSLQALDLV
ncbi:hypothetical protein M433DRAFT_157681 [Acidomyces richmondensis BFW]|nr:MAG: hypothetical protein FE78DRAFT_84204 [Acidomyces sp. 'richmondensis']KYG42623.1 hypothetical protein M433DRAFT_157681 [Acidomyces richmondensis BFW]